MRDGAVRAAEPALPGAGVVVRFLVVLVVLLPLATGALLFAAPASAFEFFDDLKGRGLFPLTHVWIVPGIPIVPPIFLNGCLAKLKGIVISTFYQHHH